MNDYRKHPLYPRWSELVEDILKSPTQEKWIELREVDAKLREAGLPGFPAIKPSHV